jgi:prepilin-type N-terminal cleavage/methylation domain-containing protein
MTHRTKGVGRRGFTLVELTVALVLLGIFGTAAVRLFSAQARLTDRQRKTRSARSVSRESVNLMLSELRMVEATGGILVATPSAMLLRVPQAIGMVCATNGSWTSVSVLPSENTAPLQPLGYAVREPSGTYLYDENGLTVGNADPLECTNAGVAVVEHGRAVTLSPPLPSTVASGTAIMLIQRVRYEFKASQLVAGRRGLWRTVSGTSSGTYSEEIAAPFDTTATFRYFGLSGDTSSVNVNLIEIRGVDLILNGTSTSSIWGRTTPEIAPYRTAVFFGNRQ